MLPDAGAGMSSLESDDGTVMSAAAAGVAAMIPELPAAGSADLTTADALSAAGVAAWSPVLSAAGVAAWSPVLPAAGVAAWSPVLPAGVAACSPELPAATGDEPKLWSDEARTAALKLGGELCSADFFCLRNAMQTA